MFGFAFKKCFEKKIEFFLLFSLFQINIFDVLYFLKKYIEIGSDIKLGLAEAWPISLGPISPRTHQ